MRRRSARSRSPLILGISGHLTHACAVRVRSPYARLLDHRLHERRHVPGPQRTALGREVPSTSFAALGLVELEVLGVERDVVSPVAIGERTVFRRHPLGFLLVLEAPDRNVDRRYLPLLQE